LVSSGLSQISKQYFGKKQIEKTEFDEKFFYMIFEII
jgi:hypothetical protein